MTYRKIANRKARLALCLFFALVFGVACKAQEWRLKLSPSELKLCTPQQVAKMLHKASNDTDKLKLNFFLGNKMVRHDPDSGLRCLNRVRTLRKATQFASWDAYIERSTGLVYAAKGNQEKAMLHYTKGLAIAEERFDSAEVANILRKMGHLFMQQGQLKKAREQYSRSLLFYDPDLSGSLTIQLRKLKSEGKYDEMIKLMKPKLAEVKSKERQFNRAKLLANIGFSYLSLGEIDSAGLYLNQAEKQAQKIGYQTLLVNIYQYQGKLRQQLGSNADGIALYGMALQEAKALQSLSAIAASYQYLANAHDSIGNYQLAKAYMDSFVLYADSQASVSNAKKIAEVEAKYQTARKDQQIAEEARKRTIAEAETKQRTIILFAITGILAAALLVVFFYMRQRRQRTKQRLVELEQKALRAQMNPHFVFNSLNSIQRLYVEGKKEQANEYMADFGSLLRKILDNSGKPVISIKEEMETLRLYLELERIRTDGMIDYRIDVNGTIDQLNQYIPPLVIQPIAENAIWHGILPKGEKGIVNIELVPKGQRVVVCTITDNGVGMKGKPPGKINGHEPKGMQITRERLGTTNSLKIEPADGGGTKVTLLIPLSK